MKRIVFFTIASLLLVMGFATAQPKEAKNLTDIMDGLKAGMQIRAVFYYEKCQLISDNEIIERVPDAIGGMTLDTFEYFAPKSIGNPEGFVSSSKTVLINHPSRGLVYNYAKVRIYESGEVRIIAQYVDPKTFEIVMDESFYTKIGDGAIFYVR